jgi:hypothetical protein
VPTHKFYRKPGPIVSEAERKCDDVLAYRVVIEVDPDPMPFEQHEDDNFLFRCSMRNFQIGQEFDFPAKNWERFAVDVYEHGSLALHLHGEGNPCSWDTSFNVAALYLRKKAYPKKKRTKELARRLLGYVSQQLFDTQYCFSIVDHEGYEVESCSGYFSEEEALTAAKEWLV